MDTSTKMKLQKCADNQEQWRLGGHSHARAICLSMCKYVTQDLGLGVGFSLTSSSPSPSIGMGDCLGAATTEDAEWVGDGERLLTGSAVAAAAHPPSFLGGCGEEGDELVPPPAGGWGAFRFRCFLSALLEECHQENKKWRMYVILYMDLYVPKHQSTFNNIHPIFESYPSKEFWVICSWEQQHLP